MEYNLLQGALTVANTTEGNTVVPFNVLVSLVDYGDEPIFHIDETNVLVLDIDLGRRINVSRIEYRFETSYASNSSVASGIKFSYKNEPFETDYVALTTYVSTTPDVYYSTSLADTWGPRYLRIEHTPSDTYGISTISGSVYGLRVINNEDVVDFGEDGSLDQVSIEVARGSLEDIKTIPIFNDSGKEANALLSIDPTYTDLDTCFAISDSKDGPWIHPLDTGTNIFDPSIYDYGHYVGTQATYGYLELEGEYDKNYEYLSKVSSGYYYTPVFYNLHQDGALISIDKYISQQGRLSTNREDAADTLEIRSTNVPPKDYSVYRTIYVWNSGDTHYYSYKDYWRETGALAYKSNSHFLSTTYETLQSYQVTIDFYTERWVGWLSTYSSSSNANAELYIFNNIGSNFKTYRLARHSANSKPINFGWREIRVDESGGIWTYFYCEGYRVDDFCDKTGYYLVYFDNTLTPLFTWFSEFNDIGVIDVDYDYHYVWYTKPGSIAIQKVSPLGTILVNFTDPLGLGLTDDMGGIAVLPNEQGVWYSSGTSLHRIDNDGNFLYEESIEGATQERIIYIALDGDGSEALWIIEASMVGRFFVSGQYRGTYDFQISMNSPAKLESVASGCWVHCSDEDNPATTHIRYVSKVNRREEYSYTPSTPSRPGPLEYSYKHEAYTRKMPLSIDAHWQNLEWNKVALQDYMLPENTYNQVRLTLRRQEPIERYDFVIDPEQDYISSDTFEQESPVPNKLLWGTWLDDSVGNGLNRVYVDNTTVSGLVMAPDWGGAEDAYISTFGRVVTKHSSSNKIEVRVKYKFGDGNTGVDSGRDENLYIYGHPMNMGSSGYIAAHLYLPSHPTTDKSYVFRRVSATGGWGNTDLGIGQLNYYEGTLRIYADSNDRLYGQVAQGDNVSFTGSYNTGWINSGQYWYWQISAGRNGSQVVIKEFEIKQGNNYFYTETPKINSMHMQNLLSIPDIAPGNYKNVYLRTQVPANSGLGPSYETNLKAMWRTPVY